MIFFGRALSSMRKFSTRRSIRWAFPIVGLPGGQRAAPVSFSLGNGFFCLSRFRGRAGTPWAGLGGQHAPTAVPFPSRTPRFPEITPPHQSSAVAAEQNNSTDRFDNPGFDD